MLDKYSTKKNVVYFSSAIMILAILIFLVSQLIGIGFSFDYLEESLNSIGITLIFIGLLAIAMAIVIIIDAILSGYYFFKKNNKEYVILVHFIVTVIMAVLCLLCIPGLMDIMSVVMAYATEDYTALYSMDYSSFITNISNMSRYMNMIKYMCYILILVVIFTWILKAKIVQISGLDFSFDEGNSFEMDFDNSSNIDFDFDSDKAKDLAQGGMDKAKEGASSVAAFFQTKNGKIVLGVIAVVVVAFIGYRIYDSFFNYTTISLLSDDTVTISCDGNNGSGYINAYFDEYAIEYDYTDAQIASFLDDIALTYDSSGDLSNGDTVTISATYDKSVAKSLKLKIVNDTYTATVSGLTEIYKTADEVPSAIKAQVKTDALNASVDNYAGNSYYTYSVTYDSMYYVYKEASGYSSEDYEALVVFKVDETYTSFWNGETTDSTYYVYYIVNDVDSNYLTDGGSIYKYTLKDSNYESVTSASDVESALQYRFSDYTLTKFSE